MPRPFSGAELDELGRANEADRAEFGTWDEWVANEEATAEPLSLGDHFRMEATLLLLEETEQRIRERIEKSGFIGGRKVA